MNETTYRRRGLGTQLLQVVIEYARHKGIKTIHGRIDGDSGGHPDRAGWYRVNGFTVEGQNIHLKL